MRTLSTFLAGIFLLLLSFSAFSQSLQTQQDAKANVSNVQSVDGASANGNMQKNPHPQIGKSSTVGWLSSFEFWMSFSVLSFGMLVFLVEIALVKLTKFQPEQTIKLLAVTLIVISTLFIITAGFDSEQIAPAMGLFGTIAGYMLGRNSGKHEEASE
jgi:hypothetical protein